MTSQKERIIDQAMQMFVTQGIKSVRMDDIAQQLGESKRTLYEMFGDKEGLLYLAMERYTECNRQRWDELSSGAHNVLEALFMVLGEVMDKADLSSRLMDNLKKFHPAVHDKLMNVGMVKNRRSLRCMLEQGIADGLFIDYINIDLAISVLYYTASALMTHKDMMQPVDMTQREAFVQIISTFFRGISTTKGLQLIDENMKRYDLAKSK
ncbi:TetR/AcrR family transcriptional regulator [uncultured Alistipes sp.]|jgi:transcriptional regulator|uniref:TetR/AcrR family transcriptional regulator n=1 Tax=uncultured Alistipes sp. TaxID=538949 RepID=UPI0025F55E14|nr:TetR/AcrR family transcriptional regulator [uncultured Alistipes sp.]